MEDSEFIVSEKRCILVNKRLTKRFCDQIVFAIRKFYEEDPSLPINLIIDCPGGEDAAFRLYSFLKSFPGTIYGWVDGECFSAATIILMGIEYKYRYCTKYSEFMIHFGRLKTVINFSHSTKKRLSLLSKEAEGWRKELFTIYKEGLKMNDKDLLDFLENTDSYLMRITSAEAKKYGFVSRVLKNEEYLPWF